MLAAASACASTTTVTQAVVNPDGTPASGVVYIRASAACQSGANYVSVNTIAVQFSNGVFTASLFPNDTCTPQGTSYSVTWKLTSGRLWTETGSSRPVPSPSSVATVLATAARTTNQFSDAETPSGTIDGVNSVFDYFGCAHAAR